MIAIGFEIGIFIALPVGPVVVMLLRKAFLGYVREFMQASALTALAVGIHVLLALFFTKQIVWVAETFPAFIYLFMGLLVLYVAFKSYQSNKKLVLKDKNDKKVFVVWYPGLLSLICPFTSLLVLNIFMTKSYALEGVTVCGGALLIIGAILGSAGVYLLDCIVVRLCSRHFSEKFITGLIKYSPHLIMFYGLKNLWSFVSIFAL